MNVLLNCFDSRKLGILMCTNTRANNGNIADKNKKIKEYSFSSSQRSLLDTSTNIRARTPRDFTYYYVFGGVGGGEKGRGQRVYMYRGWYIIYI